MNRTSTGTTSGLPAGADKRAPDPESLPPHLLRRRSRIVDAAIELLEHGEYDEIQIRDVSRRADVALGTLYRYFTSKEHLYAAALLEWAKSFDLDSIGGRTARGETDEDRIRALLTRAIKAFERRPQMVRAEIASETSNDPNARRLFDEFSKRHLAVMMAALVDTPPEVAAAVVDTTNSVMAAKLRSWALGRVTIADVRRGVDQAVDLIFSEPPHAPSIDAASSDEAPVDRPARRIEANDRMNS